MTVRSPHISIFLFIYLICERVNFERKGTLTHEIRQSLYLGIFKRQKYLISISELCTMKRRNESAASKLPRGTTICPAFFVQFTPNSAIPTPQTAASGRWKSDLSCIRNPI